MLVPQKFWERLGGMAVPTRKARLVGLLLASTRQAASALLELSSSTLSSWSGLCQWLDWAPHWLSTCALAPQACSWSLQDHEPESTASSTSGSLKKKNRCRWLACSNTLACPWWSLEGSLGATINQPISYKRSLWESSSACQRSWIQSCWRSCRAPVEDGLWIHNAIGRWAYQAKEEEQVKVVLFVTKN
jgi:hypothetical protein